ncbi:MAG: hypothetical protein QOC93_3050 [Actinomycetota bacterium]|jgi:hypothetical protein|nr:hypothetical protein [Actinomycetota bacterium]
MRVKTTTSWLTASAALLATAVMVGPMSAAPASAAAAAAPVTHRTIFATKAGALHRLTLSPTGAVIARTPVAGGGAGAVASDYNGSRLVFVRPGDRQSWLDDRVWLREPTGASRLLAAGRLATLSPGGTGATITRYVTGGREPGSVDPRHDEHSVYRIADGHVFPLPFHEDGYIDRRIRNSHDGTSRWMLVRKPGSGPATTTLMRYDGATGTTAKVLHSGEYDDCHDMEILPSGANALLACHTKLMTIRLADGAILHRTPFPNGTNAETLDGRLNPTTMLLSMQSPTGRWLAALDVTTMRTRTLPGTAGYTNGVAAY